ncbi:MAG: protein-export chaperone SecB [Micavibrio sp.]|nr:protein-export chaperone SecB [Micavibrio sp.]|tara:strand:- start:485 stop:997 length:513 start_codon:yes stop_codon:yes gene_type:complete
MADKENKNTKQTGDNAPQFGLMVHTQYVKDFSFENPNAPESFSTADGSAPKMDANINMSVRQLDKEKALYEVVLEVSSTAKRQDKTLFMTEIQYGLVASVNKDVPEQHHHPLLLIEGPKMAFPFVRQLLASAIQAGGYPPLLLNPVNFEELYRQQYIEQAKAMKDTKGTA